MTKRLILSKQLSRPVPGNVSAAIARDLLRLVEEFGDDPQALMRQAGLAHLAPMLLMTGRAGSPLAHDDFTRLYAHCTWVLDDHAARQEAREPLTKAGLDMMCHCIITCRTLRDAIERADRFSQLLAPRLSRLVLKEEDGVARLSMPTIRRVRNACAYLSDLTGLSTYHRLFSWLIGEDMTLLGAAMRYPPLLDERTVSHLVPCPVQHGAPENGLRFASAYLDRPVIRSPFELDHLLIFFPFDMEAPLSKEAPLSERIAHLFSAMLASSETPAPAAQLARRFGISVATLKRRLLAEGTSLARIKAEARLGMACQLLSDPRLTITEVGRRARFSDTGAFRRAFHHWTGQSPSAWRDAHMSQPMATGG
ncbi:AraC family transcriptional regulator [Sphingobium sp.]|uniref:AraC family transcriptional regulator n=1 Tax=Sphingobium sp. TaxID=1912891 RepID=UPI002CE25097|nr:AraC family transcriptional regulator ligand-binding domain-containing protein [Sphingobium sp.]HUD91733.1 AraC family transcriptional regulator ligand-binding domain-containing protein [Sphingobium sp.]